MKMPYTGGCRCGDIRYECSAAPLMAGICHCRECQRSAGSASVAHMAVPEAALKVTGEVRYHDYRADSGNIASHGFCPRCGSHVVGKSTGMPDLMTIRAASLDDPSWFKPAMHVYTASAQPWDYMNLALPKFPKMPPM